jgi:hypothetical protein
MRLSDRIADMCGPEAAIDIFKNVAQIRHARMLPADRASGAGLTTPTWTRYYSIISATTPIASFPSQKEGSSPERPGISPNKNLRNGSLMRPADASVGVLPRDNRFCAG